MKKELQLLFSRLFITSTLLLALFITLSSTSSAQAINFQGGYGSHDMTNGTCINSTERQISDSRSICECNNNYTINSSSNGCEPVTWTKYCPGIGDPSPINIGYSWEYAKSATQSMFDWRKYSPTEECNPCPSGQNLSGRGTTNPTCTPGVITPPVVNPPSSGPTLVSTQYAAVYGYDYATARAVGGTYHKDDAAKKCYTASAFTNTQPTVGVNNVALYITKKTYSDNTYTITNTDDALSAAINSLDVVDSGSCIDQTTVITYDCSGKQPGDLAGGSTTNGTAKWCWNTGTVTSVTSGATIERQVNISLSNPPLQPFNISPNTLGSWTSNDSNNGGSPALLAANGQLLACARTNAPKSFYAPAGYNSCGTSAVLSTTTPPPSSGIECTGLQLPDSQALTSAGAGGTTGTYCQSGSLWSTANWGTSQEKYKQMSCTALGKIGPCTYGCKQTVAGPTGGSNPVAHCMTASEAGVNANATIGDACRLYATDKNYPSLTIDRAYNLGHLQTMSGTTRCILDQNSTSGGGTPGNFNESNTVHLSSAANSCWMYTGADGMPTLGGNVSATCKSFFELKCSAQYTNRVARTGLWNWDTKKCDFTKYYNDVKAGTDGLPMTTRLNSGSSDYLYPNGGTGKYIGLYDFNAVCGSLWYNNWYVSVKSWGTCLNTAGLGEWNGVKPNDVSNTVTVNGICGTGYYSSGNTAASMTGLLGGPQKLSECPGSFDGLTVPDSGLYKGTDNVDHQRWSLAASTQSCCLNGETHIGYGFMLCKNENYLQNKVNTCKDACVASGFSPVQPIPSWCPNAAPKTCSCAAKYTGTTGNYTVGASQDCITNAPATQPTTCAAQAPTLSCSFTNNNKVNFTTNNVPYTTSSCGIYSDSGAGAPISTQLLSLTSSQSSALSYSPISGVTGTSYGFSIKCGGVVKATASCIAQAALACTNGNTAQNAPSGSFDATTMTTRRVVESTAACLTTYPSTPICMTISTANPTLYATQQLGAYTTEINGKEICFDSVRNRMRVAADTGCADTGIRTQAVCPAPTTPSMTILGDTTILGNPAEIRFTPPVNNMQCAVYGRTATGIDYTNVLSATSTYATAGVQKVTVPETKLTAAQDYGYNAVCSSGGTSAIVSPIITVHVLPPPTAKINLIRTEGGDAYVTLTCENSNDWDLIKLGYNDRATGTIIGAPSIYTTPEKKLAVYDISSATKDKEYRYYLFCNKEVQSNLGSVWAPASDRLKLIPIITKVLIDTDGATTTSSDRIPLINKDVGINNYNSKTNSSGVAYSLVETGVEYSTNILPLGDPYLMPIGFINPNDSNDIMSSTRTQINSTTAIATQVAGNCGTIGDEAKLARYRKVDYNNSKTFDQADLDFVTSQSGKTCTSTDVACNNADITGDGQVNSIDIGITKGLITTQDKLTKACTFGPSEADTTVLPPYFSKDSKDDTLVYLVKYKTPAISSSIVSSTTATTSCAFGDSLYIDKINPLPRTSVVASSTYASNTIITFTYDSLSTYEIKCANHGYATTTVAIGPELGVTVTQNAIVPTSTPATIKWNSIGNACEIVNFAGASFSPKINVSPTPIKQFSSGSNQFEYTFTPANAPFDMNVTHLPGAVSPNAPDIGLKVVCWNTSSFATSDAMANIIIYSPVTANIVVPPNTTTSTLSCSGSYNKAVISVSNANTVLYDKTVSPVVGQVGPWSYPNMTSDKVYTLTCSGYGPSANAVYPTGAFTLNAEINADMGQSTDKLIATSSAPQGRYTQLSWSTTGKGVTCNTTQTKQLSTGSFTAPANVSTSISASLAVPNAGTYTNNPVVKWTITCTDKNNTTLSKTLTLNVGSIPVAEIGTPVYNGRYYNPNTKEGAASTYEFSLKCTNATSYQVQKKVGNAWVNATGTDASGVITVSPWTGTIYKQPYKDTIDGQQFKLQCMNTELSDDSNIVTYSTASTYPFVTDFRTTVSEFTVVGADTYIVISPTIRNPVDCKVSVFEASDVTGFATLAQFSSKAPASGSNSALMQSQVNTAYNGDAQPKLNTPAFQNGTQEGRINTVNLDKAKTFILTCPKYNAANPTTPIIDVCTKNNTSSRCIFTVYRKTTSSI